MPLIPFTGTVNPATLKANFDDATSTISTQATQGQVDYVHFWRKGTLASTDAIALRSLDFTAPDDLELRVLRVLANHTAAGRVVTATLTQTDGDTAFLVDKTFSVSATSINGTAQASLDRRTVTGDRVRLLRGVRYRLTISVDAGAAITAGQVSVVLRTRRRSA